MNMLLGIGNELNGDDAIGCYIARNFYMEDWVSIDCGTVPENYLGKVIKEKPQVLIVIDSAHMGLRAGEIRRIQKDSACSAFVSTHTLALKEFLTVAEKHAGKIILIGIQPKSTEIGEEISKECLKSAKKITGILKKGSFEKIPCL
ncbi:MAG: hydrogenase 3 maturation endopeptidase HyCI [Candidatus Diapherotrites archaeon]|nr:hydrogenase 3 maturation endopeptidase HyCI [Candidatus Diapherotrites archaeon]